MIMIGTGASTGRPVHVAYLADVFDAFLEDDSARGYYLIGNGVYSTVAELMETAAAAVGAPGGGPRIRRRGAGPPRRLLRRTLLLDQGTSAAKVRSEIDGNPPTPPSATSSSTAIGGVRRKPDRGRLFLAAGVWSG